MFGKEMTPQFYFEHYYIWGYAVFSSIAFLVASFGGVYLICRRRSFDTKILVTGTLAVIASRAISDVGWLVLSQGTGTINYLVHPEREGFLHMIRKLADILYFYGVIVLALWMPFLLRALGQPQPESQQKKKPNKSEMATPRKPSD